MYFHSSTLPLTHCIVYDVLTSTEFAKCLAPYCKLSFNGMANFYRQQNTSSPDIAESTDFIVSIVSVDNILLTVCAGDH